MSQSSLKSRFKALRFFAGEPPTDDPVLLTQRRVFILPTQRGLGFVVLIFLVLLIAFVYNNNLAYLLGFLLSSVFFITILHSFKSLSGLVVQKGQSKPVFAGEAAAFSFHIANPTDAERYQLQVLLEQTENISLVAQGKAVVTLYANTEKRGWHAVDKITLSSTYPLGLFRAWSPIRFDFKVLVYPKPASLESPFPETAASQSERGISNKGADEFYGLQTYQAGDPVRRIHWKSFAKGLGVFSKQYGGGTAADIWLDYEYANGYNTEERLSQLCRWVIDAEQAGIRYGFVLPGLKLQPANGLPHYQRCLEALALF
ncbi:MAG: DUF58 domain-containing protein [Methylovulum sp.]|nr:DUF58 domain-containing protein [Methylovulum sp.]